MALSPPPSACWFCLELQLPNKLEDYTHTTLSKHLRQSKQTCSRTLWLLNHWATEALILSCSRVSHSQHSPICDAVTAISVRVCEICTGACRYLSLLYHLCQLTPVLCLSSLFHFSGLRTLKARLFVLYCKPHCAAVCTAAGLQSIFAALGHH